MFRYSARLCEWTLLIAGLSVHALTLNAEPPTNRSSRFRDDRRVLLTSPEPGWGDLRMRFVADDFGHDDPAEGRIEPAISLTDKSPMALTGERGVRDVVVWIRRVSRIHSMYHDLSDPVVTLTESNHGFVPRLAPIKVGQTLLIRNLDSTNHIALIRPRRGPELNVLLPPGEETTWKFSHAEPWPVAVSCSFHPSMRAHVVVVGNPYVASSDDAGAVRLANLPAGEELDVCMWLVHPSSQTRLDAAWHARFKIVVPSGGILELGEIFVPTSLVTSLEIDRDSHEQH